jgi:hypothetical protein
MNQQEKPPAALARGPQVAERRDAGPMDAAEIPSMDDLTCLGDIR